MFVMALGRFELQIAGKAGWGYSLWSWTDAERLRVAWSGIVTLDEMRAMKKKKKAADAVSAKHLAALESTVFGHHHSIIAHCAITQYDDGDPREPGWITIRTFGSVWQLEAKDPDTCQFLRVQQPTFDDAVTLLALLLDSEDAPWERDIWAEQQKARKGKKK